MFFLFFLENSIWNVMQIVSIGDNLHEFPNPPTSENKKKIYQCVVWWKFYAECEVLNIYEQPHEKIIKTEWAPSCVTQISLNIRPVWSESLLALNE